MPILQMRTLSLREVKVPNILELVSMPLSSLQLLCSTWSRDHCSGRQQGRRSTGLGVWSPRLRKSLPLSGLSVFICNGWRWSLMGCQLLPSGSDLGGLLAGRRGSPSEMLRSLQGGQALGPPPLPTQAKLFSRV